MSLAEQLRKKNVAERALILGKGNVSCRKNAGFRKNIDSWKGYCSLERALFLTETGLLGAWEL